MKILVLNGSPKREHSDTLRITRAFLDGMQTAAPQEVQTIHVIDRHIEYCTGCFSCMRNGGSCIHDDDMRAILNEILASDLLIWSFPLYCYGMPAPLKALLDRTLPLSSMAMQKVGERYEHVEQADFSHLRYLMICGCGFPNSKHNFEPATAQFRLCFPGSHTMITVPESPMFNAPEAAVVTEPRLALVKKAGKQYAKAGEIDAALLDEICSPMIPEETYAAIVNGAQENAMNKNDYTIRLEEKSDYSEVENLVRESFWNVYRPGCSEHYVIHLLRDDPAFVRELDFVMEQDGRLIGQNMFMNTVIHADDGRVIPVLTMGPICITPERKRQGYGKKLLDYSLEKAAELGFGAVLFEGNIGFYGKSGFDYARRFGIRYHDLPEGADDSFFLCKELICGYLDGITGVYQTPQGYYVDDDAVDAFDKTFPPKVKQKLPGQLF